MTEPARAAAVGRLSWPRTFAFAASSFPLTAISVAMLVYLPPHMASHLAVPLAVVGAAWATVRFLDVGVDLVLGLAMDAVHTPIGRYRPWMLAGAPILMAAVFQLFMARPGVGSAYLIVWLLAIYLGVSMLGLAQSAWGASVAVDYHDRSRVYSVLSAVGVAGAMTVLTIPIVAPSLGLSEAQIAPAMGWLLLATTPAAVAVAVLFTPDRPLGDPRRRGYSAADVVKVLVHPNQVRLFLAQLSLSLGPNWMSALYLFFFRDSRGLTEGQSSILLAIYLAAGVLGAPITGRVSRRLGKHRTLMMTTTAYALGLFTVLAVPKGEMWAGAPTMFWCGFMASGFDLMLRAMLADVGDEVRLDHGKEQMSLLFALNSLATKLSPAFAIGLTFPLLAWFGYDASVGAVNTPRAVHGLEMVFLAGPIVFVLLGGACMIGWRLDAHRHAVIRAELDARDASARVGEGA
ncbi:MFS transporter [Phenylobacterium sp.]|uniref:MFS transporter n=1 Tax=Phenylobacterium sp. TaxID=1871053 RepID=UPI0035B4BA79